MTKHKALVRHDKKLYIHNDLAQGAYYLRQRVAERVKKDDRDGLGYDRFACLVFSVFEMEAKVNFLISVLMSRRKLMKLERRSLRNKIEHLARKVDCRTDFGSRPYKTIIELVKFRNTVAHGKPEIVSGVQEIEGTKEQILKSTHSKRTGKSI